MNDEPQTVRRRRPPRLATRLITAQVLVITVGAIAFIAAAGLFAPHLFRSHLAQTGETDPIIVHHAEQAFTSSFAVALLLATGSSLVAAGLVSWFIVRRIAHPVERLADATESLAAGKFDVQVPDAAFSSEIARLTGAFELMAGRLAQNEVTRRRLLADLAHELRTPLATLEAYVDGLEDHVVPAEAASYSTMRDQLTRLRRLSGDLREAAMAEEHALGIDLEPCDAAEIVQAAVAAAAPSYQQAGTALENAVGTDPAPVLADPQRMQQVLSNLLDNALRHTRSKVRVELTGRDPVTITVADDGDGLAPGDLDLIFERFFRADPSRVHGDSAGSGLGLTIARAIVRDHGGDLTAGSEGTDRGAVFTVTLPGY